MMIIYLAIGAAVGWMYCACPPRSCRNEDQGYIIVNVQLPPGATLERTQAVMSRSKATCSSSPRCSQHGQRAGLLVLGPGQNAALAFVTLKDWDERKGPEQSAPGLAGRAMGALIGHPRRLHLPAEPAAHSRTGRQPPASTFRLQDRGGKGHDACWPRATSCWAWPRKARCCRRAARRPGRRAAAAASTSTATRPPRWA
jgi:multidrug efflux pump